MEVDMKRRNRWIAMMLCMLLLVLPILSECFIATHKQHVCTGNNCAVCLELHMAEQILQALRMMYLPLAWSMPILCAFVLAEKYRKQIHRVNDTLITWKVELLN